MNIFGDLLAVLDDASLLMLFAQVAAELERRGTPTPSAEEAETRWIVYNWETEHVQGN